MSWNYDKRNEIFNQQKREEETCVEELAWLLFQFFDLSNEMKQSSIISQYFDSQRVQNGSKVANESAKMTQIIAVYIIDYGIISFFSNVITLEEGELEASVSH